MASSILKSTAFRATTRACIQTKTYQSRLLSTSAAAHSDRSRTYGFIGVGAMGYNMLANMVSKRAVDSGPEARPSFVVYDANEQAVTRALEGNSSLFPGLDIKAASSPAGVARLASTIVTMLPSSSHVTDVYTSPASEVSLLDGLSELEPSAVRSTLFIDATTLDVQIAQGVSSLIRETGASMIDAPVSGGTVGARDGTLAFMCGGEVEDFEKAKPVLELMGKRIVHVGPSGSGLIAKICNNLLLGIQMLGTAEAMLLGTRLGLKPEVLAGVINSSTGRCWSSEINNPFPGALREKSTPADRAYSGGFLSKLMAKDLGLALAAANQCGAMLPAGTLTTKVYDKLAANNDYSDLDFSVVLRWLEVAIEGAQKAAESSDDEQ